MSFLDRITGRDKTQIPLYEDDGLDALEDGQWQQQNWLTYTGRNFGLATVISPFQLTETLLQVQYRGNGKAGQSSGAAEGEPSTATALAEAAAASEVGP
jgi:hypothetical protein